MPHFNKATDISRRDAEMSSYSSKSELNKTNIAPWLSVSNVAEAINYYQAAFGVVELYCLNDDDGKPIVAQLSLGGADFWIQEDPDSSPDSVARGSFRMIVSVNDPDSMFVQALAAGAAEVAPVSEGYGWRVGRLVDPFGYHWEIGKPLSNC
ncbi:VOC family protein [Neobacillus drentensis]|uniref:VOC family protein n=1 Tax=Neobacillus drentensis TaxID=220684 RepID=UPI003002C1C3